MHRTHLVSILKAKSGRQINADRLSWNYFNEEASIKKLSVDELSKIDEENESNDKESERATDDKSEQTQINERLGRLYSNLCATILEDTITKMRILEQCETNLVVQKVMFDKTFLKGKKYGVNQLVADESADDKIAQIGSKDLSVSKTKIMKLYADRDYITEVIVSLYKELSMNKCFTVLTKCVQDKIDGSNYLVNLEEDENKNKMHAKDLNRQLQQQRNRFKIEIYEKQMLLCTLHDKIKDSKHCADIADRYVGNWGGSRSEQHNQIILNDENKQSDAIEHYKMKFNYEYRAHAELEAFLSTAINDTLGKTDELMKKYDNDIEAMNLKIQLKKYEYLNSSENRIRLEEMVKKRDKLKNQWISYIEEREKAHMYRENMYNSACTIQAWWRGLLVRLRIRHHKIKTKNIRR